MRNLPSKKLLAKLAAVNEFGEQYESFIC
jgi:hypothetical protein